MRTALVILLALVAVNAVLGGYYALSGAPDVPLEWLAGSPFDSYRVPGWILVVVVGGSCFVAAVAVYRRWAYANLFAGLAALVLAIWIAAQVAIIGYVSWLQPTVAVIAIAIGWLAWFVEPGAARRLHERRP